MSKDGVTASDIIANLRGEFLEDTRRRLDRMMEIRETAARTGQPEPGYASFKAELHTMKGMGQSFGFASITVISRRLEEVLEPMTAAAFLASEDIAPFLDAISGVVESGAEISDGELEEALSGLIGSPPETET